jgi:4-amino-4-deoxy-L-arabinose transferase-like glycosyltransferase
VRPTLALRPVLALILAKSALNLAVAGRYGWQRDELYYRVAGLHVQGGYVEFPPVTALFAALARVLFGDSLVDLRAFAVAAGAATIVVAALVARELGGRGREQAIAAALVGFSPLLIATNGLFQPVSFDQLATMIVLWLALRLALGRGSWVALGVAAGIGLETKYTLAVVLVALVASFAVWRRDVLQPTGLAVAIVIAGAFLVPNLVWQAGHDWSSVRWFVDPPGSATDESRPEYILNVLLLTGVVTVTVAVAGVRRLVRDPTLRPLGWTIVAVVGAYFALGGKSYYALPVMLFALAAGAAAVRRPRRLFAAFAVLLVALLPVGLPVLPQRTAIDLGLMDARTDYADELGWPQLAQTVERRSRGADVVIALNYGQAGALELYGRRLPPVASAHVTFRWWRPDVRGRRAVVVGFDRLPFCSGFRVVARIRMPVDNEERGRPIARCTLDAPLERVWPQLVALYD